MTLGDCRSPLLELLDRRRLQSREREQESLRAKRVHPLFTLLLDGTRLGHDAGDDLGKEALIGPPSVKSPPIRGAPCLSRRCGPPRPPRPLITAAGAYASIAERVGRIAQAVGLRPPLDLSDSTYTAKQKILKIRAVVVIQNFPFGTGALKDNF